MKTFIHDIEENAVVLTTVVVNRPLIS